MRLRQCANPNCTVKVQPNIYACKPHWFELPKALRDKIWAAYEGHGDYDLAHEDAQAFWLKPSANMVKQSVIDLLRGSQKDYEGNVSHETGELVHGDPNFPMLISKISALLERL